MNLKRFFDKLDDLMDEIFTEVEKEVKKGAHLRINSRQIDGALYLRAEDVSVALSTPSGTEALRTSLAAKINP